MRTSALTLVLIAACSSSPALPHVDGPGKTHSPAAAATAAGRTLEYFGGPVVPNAKVYAVWWGGAGAIDPAVTAAHGGIADFFAGVLDSNFIDWLDEYDTDVNAMAGSHSGQPGTNQFIGRGNFAGAFSLNGVQVVGNLNDSTIQSTLNSAFNGGTLPPPDANTIYAVYFPSGLTIVASDGSQSCLAFGAYHDAVIESSRPNAYYLVMPDCGGSFSNWTLVTSHEMVEAITDGQPTPGSNPDYPQAWNDSGGNEAADLCEGTSGSVATALGSFTVQGIWDERSQGCKVSVFDAQDFSVSVSPNSATLATGASGTYTVKTATTAGSAQSLALSVAAPAGISASVSPSSITSGGTATLTVTAGSPSASKGLQIVVRADPASGRPHTASLLLTVGGTTGGGLTTQITSPADGATVSGSTPVTATASSGANKIEIYFDGTLLGSGSGASLTSNWDTTQVADGAHTLTSKAYDASGNVASSAAVSVTVSNDSGTTQCPPGTTNVGGQCVPTGCGTSGSGGLAGACALGLLGLFKAARRRAA
ncbi:MAG TPA: Ig-like domain-containing protein [Myxococcales bacterium]|nr:Ig-like domain-containing protein [Myxococcales bacterium]